LVIRVFFFGLPKGGGSDSVKRFFFLNMGLLWLKHTW